MVRAQNRDVTAYGELIFRFQDFVYGVVRAYVGDWSEAQDLTQDALIRGYQRLDQLKDPARFGGWIRSIAASVSMDWQRARKEVLADAEERLLARDASDRIDVHRAVSRALETLPMNQRIAVVLYHLNGFSYGEIAEFMDQPIGTVKSHINRGRKKLGDVLADYADTVTEVIEEYASETQLPANFHAQVVTRGSGSESEHLPR